MGRVSLLLLLLVALFAAPAWAAAPTPAQAPAKGKLVFVATTGLEDLGTLSSSLRHAKVALESGHLSDVVWLTYGRAVISLDPTVKAVPEEIRKHARAAAKAGVRLVACGHALDKYGIDRKRLENVKVVDNGVDELARLVAAGYQVIRY